MRDKYESELRELEHSERSAVEKQQELRKQQMEMEAEVMRLQALLRQKEQETKDITQVRSKSLKTLKSTQMSTPYKKIKQLLNFRPGTSWRMSVTAWRR